MNISTSKKNNNKWESLISRAYKSGADIRYVNRVRILIGITDMMNTTFNSNLSNKDICDVLWNMIDIDMYSKDMSGELFTSVYYLLQCRFDSLDLTVIQNKLYDIIKGGN